MEAKSINQNGKKQATAKQSKNLLQWRRGPPNQSEEEEEGTSGAAAAMEWSGGGGGGRDLGMQDPSVEWDGVVATHSISISFSFSSGGAV